MAYKVITNTDKDTSKTQQFDTFKEAMDCLNKEVDEWGEHFTMNQKSKVFYEILYHNRTEHKYQLAGTIYIKKID